MTEMTKGQWKRFVEQWRSAGPALARIHRDEIRTRGYDAQAVDDLLRIGDDHWRSRESSGLVELQRWLKKLADSQGLRPRAVHDERTEYGS